MPVIVAGNAGILSYWDGAAYKPVGCLTDFDVALSKNVITRETLCNPGVVEKRSGNEDSTLNFNGLYANTDTGAGGDDSIASFDDILPLFQAGTTQDFSITTGSGKTYYATGFISELNAGWSAGDEDATFSGALAVNGQISETDPNV